MLHTSYSECRVNKVKICFNPEGRCYVSGTLLPWQGVKPLSNGPASDTVLISEVSYKINKWIKTLSWIPDFKFISSIFVHIVSVYLKPCIQVCALCIYFQKRRSWLLICVYGGCMVAVRTRQEEVEYVRLCNQKERKGLKTNRWKVMFYLRWNKTSFTLLFMTLHHQS